MAQRNDQKTSKWLELKFIDSLYGTFRQGEGFEAAFFRMECQGEQNEFILTMNNQRMTV